MKKHLALFLTLVAAFLFVYLFYKQDIGLNLFIFETVDYSTIERFTEGIEALGGTLISVESIGKIWIGDRLIRYCCQYA